MKQVALALAFAVAATPALAAPGAASLFAAFESERQALGVRSFALSLDDNLAAVKEGDALARERAFAEKWIAALAGLDETSLTLCDRIDHEKALHEARMVKRRADIGAAPRFREKLAQGLSASEEGRAFYDLLLDWQLGVDVSADENFKFGERQIKTAKAWRKSALHRVNSAGEKPLTGASPTFALNETRDAAAIQRSFENAERIVRANMEALFFNYPVKQATIARAERGGPLAQTPGFYDGSTGSFFYNVPCETYDLADRDWLYLHEATPGHHFQNAIAGLETACKSAMPALWAPAYIEGWGAYVETLGRQLGLYEDPRAELAAADWNLVRSVRVAIDVGLNHRGWTDEETLAYWRKAIPDKDDLARREIDRMRRWPAQVATYKLGAFWISQARDRLAAAQGDAFDERAFHDLVLGDGPMPIPVFEALVDRAMAEARSEGAEAGANRGGIRE
jgi:uncharacterized protein (DUF885 family)